MASANSLTLGGVHRGGPKPSPAAAALGTAKSLFTSLRKGVAWLLFTVAKFVEPVDDSKKKEDTIEDAGAGEGIHGLAAMWEQRGTTETVADGGGDASGSGFMPASSNPPLYEPTAAVHQLRKRGGSNRPRPQYVPVEDGFGTTAGNPTAGAKYGNLTGMPSSGTAVPPPPPPPAIPVSDISSASVATAGEPAASPTGHTSPFADSLATVHQHPASGIRATTESAKSK